MRKRHVDEIRPLTPRLELDRTNDGEKENILLTTLATSNHDPSRKIWDMGQSSKFIYLGDPWHIGVDTRRSRCKSTIRTLSQTAESLQSIMTEIDFAL